MRSYGWKTVAGRSPSFSPAFRELMGFTVINVKDYGAVGDGSHDDTAAIQAAFDAAYGTSSSPHGTNYTLNSPVFFPAGNYKVSGNPALTLTNVQGAHIFGAGRFTTTITHVTASAVLLETDGFEYSVIERIYFNGSGGAGSRCLNLNHHTTGFVSVQSVTLADLFINNFEIGINLAASSDGGGSFGQGSEILISNCYLQSCSSAAIASQNNNALCNTMVGGNIAGCAIGIHVNAGAFNAVLGVSFQNQTGYDIQIESQSENVMAIVGCRCESFNFVSNLGGQKLAIIACHQSPPGDTAGDFCNNVSGNLTIESCLSRQGRVLVTAASNATIRSSTFYRSDWLQASGLWNYSHGAIAQVTAENVQTAVGGSLRQRLYSNESDVLVTRTYDTQAAALTDHTALYTGPAVTVTITLATPGIVTITGASVGFVAAGTPVVFTTTGALPTGLTAGTVYFVTNDGNLTSTTFAVSDTLAHALAGTNKINTSGSQSGVHKVQIAATYSVGDVIQNSAVAAGGSPGWICTTAGQLATGGGAVFKTMANVAP